MILRHGSQSSDVIVDFAEEMTSMLGGQEEASTASMFCTSYMHDDTSACLVCALVLMWIVGPGMIPRRLSVIRRVFLYLKPAVALIEAVPLGCILVGVMQTPSFRSFWLVGLYFLSSACSNGNQALWLALLKSHVKLVGAEAKRHAGARKL